MKKNFLKSWLPFIVGVCILFIVGLVMNISSKEFSITYAFSIKNLIETVVLLILAFLIVIIYYFLNKKNKD